jgi:hypothetical protein
MAHKYNIFVLGLLDPDKFKSHCRDYIGITERAVRVSDLRARPMNRVAQAADVVHQVERQEGTVARNRAYVVAQYFAGMHNALAEGYRVLKPGGLYILVVGESNRICGITVPTADVLRHTAEYCGFHVELAFFHSVANKSSMRLRRSHTGGEINRERIYVFRKK